MSTDHALPVPAAPPHRLVTSAARALARLRAERPKVHVLTNFVAMNLSANVLLAVGAVPSMTFRAAVIEDFVRSAASLVVNLGMLDQEREAAIEKAVPSALQQGKPWLLDPVKVERSGARRDLALKLLGQGPAVLRANAGEIEALDGGFGAGQRDDAVARLARRFGCVVARTGPVDFVSDGLRHQRLGGGSPLMERVTAMGCAASALTGAFLAVEPDPFAATAAALLVFAVAGGIAAERARGPGSFQVELLDALYGMGEPDLAVRAKLP